MNAAPQHDRPGDDLVLVRRIREKAGAAVNPASYLRGFHAGWRAGHDYALVKRPIVTAEYVLAQPPLTPLLVAAGLGAFVGAGVIAVLFVWWFS